MRRSIMIASLALVAASCGGAAGGTTTSLLAVDGGAGSPQATTAITTNAGPATTDSATTTIATTAAPDFALFLLAVEESLVDTPYEEVVVADADVFIALGQLMCEQLDQGATPDDLLGRFLGELESDGVAGEDEAFAIGVTLGVAVELMCPRHRGALE